MTRKTVISLPDDLYRDIERARKRSKQDRSTLLQEAAADYLQRKTVQEKIGIQDAASDEEWPEAPEDAQVNQSSRRA